MVKCKEGAAEILCDEPTKTQANRRAVYTPLEPMALKVRNHTIAQIILKIRFVT